MLRAWRGLAAIAHALVVVVGLASPFPALLVAASIVLTTNRRSIWPARWTLRRGRLILLFRSRTSSVRCSPAARRRGLPLLVLGEIERLEELRQLARRQVPPSPDWDAGDGQRTEANSTQPGHRDADALHHPVDDVIDSFEDDELEDQSLRCLAQDAKLAGDDAMTTDDDAVADALQGLRGWSGQRQNLVLLVKPITRMHDAVGDITVVGQQEDAFRVTIEPANRIDALPNLDQIHDGPPVSLILGRRDIATWLVQNDIAGTLRPQYFAVDSNLRPLRIDAGAELRDNLAVDGDTSRPYEIFGGAAGPDAASCHHALQAFHSSVFL
jgi:hypothetical protein